MVRADPRVGLAEVLRRHGSAYLAAHPLSFAKAKVWRAILACRTAALGGHVDVCDSCGTTRRVYFSCRNRHCSQCQTRAKEAWLAARRREVLPVPLCGLPRYVAFECEHGWPSSLGLKIKAT